jgi:MarR family transcriptional regulator, 2-MHQ and catechol-resistance regulon repressor
MASKDLGAPLPSHHRGTPDEQRALTAYITLMRASSSVNARVLPVLQAEYGVTPTQLAVLEALWHLGPMRQCDLAGKLLVSASNLTTVIDNLERDALVRRDRDPQDRRASIVSLTAAGETRVSEFFPSHVVRLTETMSALSADELVLLADLCRKLGRGAVASEHVALRAQH